MLFILSTFKFYSRHRKLSSQSRTDQLISAIFRSFPEISYHHHHYHQPLGLFVSSHKIFSISLPSYLIFHHLRQLGTSISEWPTLNTTEDVANPSSPCLLCRHNIKQRYQSSSSGRSIELNRYNHTLTKTCTRWFTLPSRGASSWNIKHFGVVCICRLYQRLDEIIK